MKTLLIFLKAPYSGHKMREETMCNMWSCVFPFHYVQNYHGNLGFLSWNIIEKSLKIFEACLWEPWMSNRRRYEGLWYLGCASLHSTIPFPHTSITPFSPCPHSQLLAEGPGVLAAEVGSHSSSQASPLPTTRPLWEQSLLVTTAARNIQDKGEPALQWHHNERDGISNHQRLDCLQNHLFRRRSKEHQPSASLAFVRGIHRWPVNSPHKGPVTRKIFPFDEVIVRYETETLSTLLARREGNLPFTAGFPSQRSSYAELCCFLWC